MKIRQLFRTTLMIGTVLALGCFTAPAANAAADGVATVGLGAGVVYSTSPGESGVSQASFQFNLRLKFVYFLGIDLMVSPGTDQFETGAPLPRFRLSGLLYLVNSQYFAFFFGGGLSSGNFGDLFNFEAPATYARAGGGMEVTIAEHYSIGLEGFWFVPGLGVVNDNLNTALDETGELPSLDTAIPTDGFEIFAGVRYFF
ncbi:MAG: hypothetical protein KC561_06745 [Myxococcales bacterium]|nr:hypothetical protein [Myxococcales bacterium]